jgi:hypothetical protein
MVSPQAQNFFTLPDFDANFDAKHPRTRSHRTKFHLLHHTGPRKKTSTPDHMFESLIPRFELMT